MNMSSGIGGGGGYGGSSGGGGYGGGGYGASSNGGYDNSGMSSNAMMGSSAGPKRTEEIGNPMFQDPRLEAAQNFFSVQCSIPLCSHCL
jgi:hypothetical protein